MKATVGETSTYYTPDRQGEAFAIDIPIPMGEGEVTTDLEINAVRFDSEQDLDLVKTVTGSYTASSQPMTYDADGNLLTWDGWLFTWNGENRLIKAEKGLLKVEANYDYMGRRFEKKVFQGETLTKHQLFIYDGYKLIEIRDALNDNVLETAYFWQPQALDVPVAMKQGTTLGFYQYDGNKNITAIRSQDGTTLAEYHYGPFGQTLSATGDWSALNPFRFSSEYHDEETNLIYYNYRHYSPNLGRWLSRDPIEENGGINLYGMLQNNANDTFDSYGLVPLNLKFLSKYAWRFYKVVLFQGLGVLHNYLSSGDPEVFYDDEDELGEYIPFIDAELKSSLKKQNLTNVYKEYSLTRVNLAKKYRPPSIDNGIPGTTRWLLNSSSNVFIYGLYDAKCENGIISYKDVIVYYEWYDIIDGNSLVEAYKKGQLSTGDFFEFLGGAFEGIVIDLYLEKMVGIDYNVIIYGKTVIPDGSISASE